MLSVVLTKMARELEMETGTTVPMSVMHRPFVVSRVYPAQERIVFDHIALHTRGVAGMELAALNMQRCRRVMALQGREPVPFP